MTRSDEAGGLFSPLALRGVTLRNRIVVSPMATYSADEGVVNDWHFAHYSKFALGGAALVFTEAAKVERRGLGSVGDMGIWGDEHIAPLRRITDFLKAYGAVPGMQLNHAGRKAGKPKPWQGLGPLDRSGSTVEGHALWPVIAPSAVRYMDDWPMPAEMDAGDIDTVVRAFGAAAGRALQAGFEVLELHGATGYLIHQFLSPVANRRTDGYGGSLTNRMRFALEVTAAVRRIWPADKPLFFRTSAVDEGGWTVQDTVTLARELKQVGVDVMDCTTGGISRSEMQRAVANPLGYQVAYAEQVRRDSGMMTMAVGLIVHARQADAIIRDGQADLVGLGRELLYNPFWPVHAMAEFGIDPEFSRMPEQYGWWLDRRVKTGYRP